jgi:hypothetical protein
MVETEAAEIAIQQEPKGILVLDYSRLKKQDMLKNILGLITWSMKE